MGETYASRIKREAAEEQKKNLEEHALKFKRPSIGQEKALEYGPSNSPGSYYDDTLPLNRRLSQQSFKVPRQDSTSPRRNSHASSTTGYAEIAGSPLGFAALRRRSTLRDASSRFDNRESKHEATGITPREPGDTKGSPGNILPIQARTAPSELRVLTELENLPSDVERSSGSLPKTTAPQLPHTHAGINSRRQMFDTTKEHREMWKDHFEQPPKHGGETIKEHRTVVSSMQPWSNLGQEDASTKTRYLENMSMGRAFQKSRQNTDIIDDHQIVARTVEDQLQQEKLNCKKAADMIERLEVEAIECAAAVERYETMLAKLQERHKIAETKMKTLEIRNREHEAIISGYATENKQMQDLLIAAEDRIKNLETKDHDYAATISGSKVKIREMEDERAVLEMKTTKLEAGDQDKREKAERCPDERNKCKQAMLTLIEDLATVRRAVEANPAYIEGFQDILRKGDHEPEECILFRVELIQVIDHYVSKISVLEAQNEKLAVQTHEHKQAVQRLEDKLGKYVAISKSDEANGEDSTQKDSVFKILAEKQKAFEFVDRQYQNLKAMVIKLDPKALHDELIALRGKYVDLKDRHDVLALDRNEWKERCESWEYDYHSATARYELERQELQVAIHKMEAEELEYIYEYHKRLPKNDPDWFKVEALQKQVRNLEGDKKGLVKEKQNAEKKRDDAVIEFKRLRAVMNAVQTMSYRPASSPSNPLLSFLSDDPNAAKKTYTPKYESLRETEKRNAYLKGLKGRQKELRKKECIEEELVDKARKREMGAKYPRQDEIEKLKRRCDWDRWYVADYLGSKSATKEDRDAATRIGRLALE
jgi:hypothetical protein